MAFLYLAIVIIFLLWFMTRGMEVVSSSDEQSASKILTQFHSAMESTYKGWTTFLDTLQVAGILSVHYILIWLASGRTYPNLIFRMENQIMWGIS
jgi:hypothetical protein